MTPGEELVRVMRLFRFVREQPPGSNASDFIFAAFRDCGLDPTALKPAERPWCCAAVSKIARDWFGVAWPLRMTASCPQLYLDAKAKGMIVAAPVVGDLGLIWSAKRKRFAHIVVVTDPATQGTISANTTKPGDANPETMREGWGIFEKPWPFTPQDVFVHWWAP